MRAMRGEGHLAAGVPAAEELHRAQRSLECRSLTTELAFSRKRSPRAASRKPDGATKGTWVGNLFLARRSTRVVALRMPAGREVPFDLAPRHIGGGYVACIVGAPAPEEEIAVAVVDSQPGAVGAESD